MRPSVGPRRGRTWVSALRPRPRCPFSVSVFLAHVTRGWLLRPERQSNHPLLVAETRPDRDPFRTPEPVASFQAATSPPAFPALSRTLLAAACAAHLLENDSPELATLSEDRHARHRYAPEPSR